MSYTDGIKNDNENNNLEIPSYSELNLQQINTLFDSQANAIANQTIEQLNQSKNFWQQLKEQLTIMQNHLSIRNSIVDKGIFGAIFGLAFCPEKNDKIQIPLDNEQSVDIIKDLISRANESFKNINTNGANNDSDKLQKPIKYKIVDGNKLQISMYDSFRLSNFAVRNNEQQKALFLLIRSNNELQKEDQKRQKKEKILSYTTMGISLAFTLTTVITTVLTSLKLIVLPSLVLPFSLPIIGASLPILSVISLVAIALPTVIKMITKCINHVIRQDHSAELTKGLSEAKTDIVNIQEQINKIEKIKDYNAKKGIANDIKKQKLNVKNHQEQQNINSNITPVQNNTNIQDITAPPTPNNNKKRLTPYERMIIERKNKKNVNNKADNILMNNKPNNFQNNNFAENYENNNMIQNMNNNISKTNIISDNKVANIQQF